MTFPLASGFWPELVPLLALAGLAFLVFGACVVVCMVNRHRR
jgi:hypothetical protein